MKQSEMKIGEFARLSSATIKTLRYYDKIDLLKPDAIDRFTGYRIYSSEKLEKMTQIKTMKKIGFTLSEIMNFLALDEADENAKVSFAAAKKREIENESEMRLAALDEFIAKLKEGEKHMKKKNYYMPFESDEWIKNRPKNFEERKDDIYGAAAKLVKIYAGKAVFAAIDENGKVYVWGGNCTGNARSPKISRRSPSSASGRSTSPPLTQTAGCTAGERLNPGR